MVYRFKIMPTHVGEYGHFKKYMKIGISDQWVK